MMVKYLRYFKYVQMCKAAHYKFLCIFRQRPSITFTDVQ